MSQLQAIVLGLIPSAGIGFLFYKVIRLILEGDRKERLAHSRWEAEHADQLAAGTSVADETQAVPQAQQG